MPRKKKSKEEAPENEERWLLTYADMLTLLFALFIVMYGMSKVNEGKFRQLAQALNKTLSAGGMQTAVPGWQIERLDESMEVEAGGEKTKVHGMPGSLPSEQEKPPPDVNQKGEGMAPQKGGGDKQLPSGYLEDDLLILSRKLIAHLKKKDKLKGYYITVEERGLTVSLMASKMFFEIGRAELRPETLSLLSEVAVVLKLDDHEMKVEGHTCNLPINTYEFRNNLELSSKRANSVAHYMINSCGLGADRFAVIGYGEFRPRFSNKMEATRKLNRRVDIVVLREKVERKGSK